MRVQSRPGRRSRAGRRPGPLAPSAERPRRPRPRSAASPPHRRRDPERESRPTCVQAESGADFGAKVSSAAAPLASRANGRAGAQPSGKASSMKRVVARPSREDRMFDRVDQEGERRRRAEDARSRADPRSAVRARSRACPRRRSPCEQRVVEQRHLASPSRCRCRRGSPAARDSRRSGRRRAGSSGRRARP